MKNNKLASIPYATKFISGFPAKNCTSPERLFCKVTSNISYNTNMFTCFSHFIADKSFNNDCDTNINQEYEIKIEIKINIYISNDKNIILSEKVVPELEDGIIKFSTKSLYFPVPSDYRLSMNVKLINITTNKEITNISPVYDFIVENTVNNHVCLRYMPTLQEVLEYNKEPRKYMLITNKNIIGSEFIFGPKDNQMYYNEDTYQLFTIKESKIEIEIEENFIEVFPTLFIKTNKHVSEIKQVIDTHLIELEKQRSQKGYDIYVGQNLGGLIHGQQDDYLEL